MLKQKFPNLYCDDTHDSLQGFHQETIPFLELFILPPISALYLNIYYLLDFIVFHFVQFVSLLYSAIFVKSHLFLCVLFLLIYSYFTVWIYYNLFIHFLVAGHLFLLDFLFLEKRCYRPPSTCLLVYALKNIFVERITTN